MENMLPGNSFPQICVVSVNECVGNRHLSQEHVRSGAQSNHFLNLEVTRSRLDSPDPQGFDLQVSLSGC